MTPRSQVKYDAATPKTKARILGAEADAAGVDGHTPDLTPDRISKEELAAVKVLLRPPLHPRKSHMHTY